MWGQLGDWAESKALWGLGAHLRSSWVRPGLSMCRSCSQKFGLGSCWFGPAQGRARAAGAGSAGLLRARGAWGREGLCC